MADRKNIADDDDIGLVGKVTSGKIDRITPGDVAEGASMGAGFLLHGPLQAVTVPIDAYVADEHAGFEQAKIEKKLGISFKQGTRESSAFRRKFSELKERKWEAVVSGTGALAGMATTTAIAGAILAGPPGWLTGLAIGGAGAIGGGFAGSKLYRAAFGQPDTLALNLVSDIQAVWDRRQAVDEGSVAAALIANLPDYNERVVNRIVDGWGSYEVLRDAKERGNVKAVGDFRAVSDIINAHYEPVDITIVQRMPQLEGMTIPEQYAAMLNERIIKPKALLSPSSRTREVARAEMQMMERELLSSPPREKKAVVRSPGSVDVRAIAQNMTEMGITIAKDDEGKPQVVPSNNQSPSRNA